MTRQMVMTRNETRTYLNTMQKLCGYKLLYADFEELLYSEKQVIDNFFKVYSSELKYMALIVNRQ